jgi:hypothetical protein
MLRICNRCPNRAAFYCLLENDENPNHSHIEHLCVDCILKVGPSLIESWTQKEWDE